MSESDEAPTRSQVLADVGVDLGPRALAFWEGGCVTLGLPDHGRVLVGRSKTCDLRIDHPSVSRTHFALHVAKRAGDIELSVEDLGSSNGTRINGVRMAERGRLLIAPGDVIELGSAIVVVQRAGASATMMPPPPSSRPASMRVDPVVVSDAMKRVYRMVDLVAASRIGVLVVGETGVGKEILAEALHMRSHRGDAPFVRVNCAAMPDNLLESEMFGFEKGAFTGAGQPKPGLLEVANGGTMLLDEVGELGPATQVKLLRVLESRELMRLGALKPRPVDVRFVSATNRPLQALIEAGTFRRDLYHRLDGITLTIPPLRERREDILPLAHAFARAFAIEHDFPVPAIDAEAKSLLENHAWPGNIRELKNAVERACLLGQGGNITPQYLRLDDASAAVEQAASSASTKLRSELEALERERILEALEQTGGNQTRAAALLGIGRRTLVNRIEAYGLPRPRKGGPSGSS